MTTPSDTAIRRLLQQAVGPGGYPGIVLQVWRPGRRRAEAVGLADTATGRPRELDHRFRIGSATKAFTATVTLQLVAEGGLGLDDPIERWLPELVRGNGNDGRAITVRQLLGHTSGLFPNSDDPELWSVEVGDREGLVRVATKHPPLFAPGTGWAYSNTNDVLAGMIIESVTGNRYPDEVAARITEPLGLTGSYVPDDDEDGLRGPHVRHYSDQIQLDPETPAGSVVDVTELNMFWAWATGNMVSTIGDLGRFVRALLRGELLPSSVRDQMLAVVPTTSWVANASYGLGIWAVRLSDGTSVWGMGGALPGSWSYVFGTRDAEHLLAVNVNADWAVGDWNDPIAFFTDLLETEFRPAGG